MNSRSDWWNLD